MKNINNNENKKQFNIQILFIFLLVLLWSAVNPKSYINWMIEIFLVLILSGFFIITYKRFKFSKFTYITFLIYSVISFIRAKYAYGEIPFLDMMIERVGLSGKYYSYIIHFIQGLTFTLIIKEIALRKIKLKRSELLYYFFISIAVVISEGYEVIKYIFSQITSQGLYRDMSYKAFEKYIVGDMFITLLGAVSAILLFRRIHDKSMNRKVDS